MVLRITNIISQKEKDDVSIEYGQIFKLSITPKGNDVLDEVWNVYNS